MTMFGNSTITAYAFTTPDGFRRVGGCYPGKLSGILAGYPEPVSNLVTETVPQQEFDAWRDQQIH